MGKPNKTTIRVVVLGWKYANVRNLEQIQLSNDLPNKFI